MEKFTIRVMVIMVFNNHVFRVALAELNTNQKEVAKRLQIDESTITRIKKGMNIKIELAMRLAEAVNKTVYDLWSLDK